MKKEPWRMIIAVLSIAWIVFMWIKKDIAGLYAAMPPEQLLPMILTTAAVSLFKIAGLTALFLLVKWLTGKSR